jgi:membrane-associated phospholipid phosphatase
MPLTGLDRAIPYQPWAWMFYVSLWIYVQLPPALIANKRELLLYGFTAGVVSLVGFAFFALWPTAVPAIQVAGNSTFENIRNLDTTGNSCPSLHVAFAVFSAVWLDNLLIRLGRLQLLRALNLFWCAAIVYSTLGTKQHVVWDMVAGVPLGVFGGWLQLRLAAGLNSKAGELETELGQINPAPRKL